MNWLDISTYIVLNMHGIIPVLVMAIIGGLAVWGIVCDVKGKRVPVKKFITYPLIIALSMIASSLIPSHGKVLRVKIEKIKNEAVTEENLRKGVDAIERIATKLECKYIGCDEEAK